MGMCAQSVTYVQLFVTPWTVAFHAPPLMEFSRQECWSELPFLTAGDHSLTFSCSRENIHSHKLQKYFHRSVSQGKNK